MPEFILDTGDAESTRRFDALDSFTQGYIEALFFTDEEQLCSESDDFEIPSVAVNTATMESRFVGGNSPGFADLATDSLDKIVADCKAFQDQNAALLELAYARDYDEAQAGRDFWYTRNGHGVGFWDRDALKPEGDEYERLTAEMVANRDNRDAWGAALAKRNVIKESSLGDRLSKAARAFGGCDSYVGDDGRVYLG